MLPGSELVATFGPDHEARYSQIPQAFIEERGLVGGHAWRISGAVSGVDAHCPRQARRPAVKLLVEVVTPAADGLGDDEAGCYGVSEGDQPDAASSAADVGPNGAPDAEATRARFPAPDRGGCRFRNRAQDR
jgi:hypothetical protein